MSRNDMRRELRRIPLFADLNDEELLTLSAVLRRERFMPGQTICREGELGRGCHFVIEGEIDVLKAVAGGDPRVIATARKGEVVGQIALVDPGPRSATCRARVPTMAFRLDRDDFETLFSSGSRFARRFQLAVARQAAAQLREANHRLVTLLDAAPPRGDSRLENQRAKVLREVQEMLALSDTNSSDAIKWIG
jgi:CRP/FNR family transcriptional regulator